MGVSDKIKWTTAIRIQLVKAVIKVEQEMMNETKGEPRYTIGDWKSKWDRIADLLPSALRERMWNSRSQSHGEYKCSRVFYQLINAYRDKLAGKSGRGRARTKLTENMVNLLKKREELLNARFLPQEKSSFIYERSNSVGANENWHDDDDEHQLTASPKTSTDVEKSSQGQSMCSEKGRDALCCSQRIDGSKGLEDFMKAPRFECNKG
ncbi:unnamed protein product [Calypogeia fissa]